MFEQSQQDEIRETILGIIGIIRELSPDIESAEQLVFEQLELLSGHVHGLELRNIERRKATFDKYIEVGFSPEQAMLFMLNARVMLEKAVRQMQDKTSLPF